MNFPYACFSILIIFFGFFTAHAQNSAPKAPKEFINTWTGTLIRQAPDSTELHTTPIVWNIEKIDEDTEQVMIIQLANPDNSKRKLDTVYVNYITDGTTLTLLPTDGKCELSLRMVINKRNNITYLSSSWTNAVPGCYNMKLSMRLTGQKKAPQQAQVKPDAADDSFSIKIKEGEIQSIASPAPVKKKKLIAPTGGSTTPEGLGKMLLQALKTNNRALWVSCVHPEKASQFNTERFSEFRKWLEEDGVSNWNLVSFNRVTFTKEGFVSSDNGVSDNGEQVRRNFIVEFNYKNGEFLGAFGIMTISTFGKGNKYLIWFPGKDTRLGRKPKGRKMG